MADSIRTRLADSASRILIIALEEPAIDTYHREVYRYVYSCAFSPTYLIRVELMPDSTYMLTSKFILQKMVAGVYPKLLLIPHKEVRNPLENDSKTLLFFVEKQKLNEHEWNEFQKLLLGSYYWTFSNPMFNALALDGDNLSLESKSWPRRSGRSVSLTYHEISLANPFKGSYTDAYEYLAKKSLLFKRMGIGAGAIQWH